ncbi:hypothetical protein FQZ97_395670 [compost metagenome]
MTGKPWLCRLLPWFPWGSYMYRVYVLKKRRGGSEVLTATRTQTPNFEAAVAAFWALYRAEYDSQHLLLMSRDNRQINAYRYGSQPGELDYLDPAAELEK